MVTSETFVASYAARDEAVLAFRQADTNGDGELDQNEFVTACATGLQ